MWQRQCSQKEYGSFSRILIVLAKRSLQPELTLTHTFALPMNMFNWKISQTLLIFEQSLYAHSSRESFTARCGGDYLAKKKGEKYKCEECGLVVIVDDACGCSACDLMCCGEPMKPVKKEAKAKPKPKAKK